MGALSARFCRCNSLSFQTVPAGLKEMWLLQMIVLIANDHGEGGLLLKPPFSSLHADLLASPNMLRRDHCHTPDFCMQKSLPSPQMCKRVMHCLTAIANSCNISRSKPCRRDLCHILPAPSLSQCIWIE